MDEPKSARYTVILGVCLLLCLLMLGRMLVGRADSETPPDRDSAGRNRARAAGTARAFTRHHAERK